MPAASNQHHQSRQRHPFQPPTPQAQPPLSALRRQHHSFSPPNAASAGAATGRAAAAAAASASAVAPASVTCKADSAALCSPGSLSRSTPQSAEQQQQQPLPLPPSHLPHAVALSCRKTPTSRAEAERLLGIAEKLLRGKEPGGCRDFTEILLLHPSKVVITKLRLDKGRAAADKDKGTKFTAEDIMQTTD